MDEKFRSKWAKEKLEDQLGQIEDQIDKKALSLNDERKLLAKRKELLRKNDEWLSQRKKGGTLRLPNTLKRVRK